MSNGKHGIVPLVHSTNMTIMTFTSKLALALTAVATSSTALSIRDTDVQCITQQEMVDAIDAWTNAVYQVGEGYRDNGCDGALPAAEGAIAAAYAYEYATVHFKPTVTTAEPGVVMRPTAGGALSYFVGECAGDEHIEGDGGFGISGGTGWTEIVWGDGEEGTSGGVVNGTEGANGLVANFTAEYGAGGAAPFTFSTDDSNCEQAIASGPMCFRNENAAVCVDKTFVYTRSPSNETLPILMTVHHSSSAVEGSGNSKAEYEN
ncbi:hypothetical protein SARC_11119 [Sphaeroforma arctica JP610]|uniref:Uncharacterized protein n=1 Tax=Sphaeroforma arctica JP610 TaxID=667725 RepID=A0A0L0FHW4_9EUKA|nr:hypothetical protein SARC_11119 [Sphaeroforma arctica JP610]KNC76377.1 hypothetical protein SARC_11119 [Sphaeroforma arctica JP610]|eukprot:XP_014150279.1 hypothetical protein SARC_11119 [Sphaeroforma arctica JP610]